MCQLFLIIREKQITFIVNYYGINRDVNLAASFIGKDIEQQNSMQCGWEGKLMQPFCNWLGIIIY